jgi:hypothetical protein
MPNPKTEAHEALALLAGTWQSTCSMAAMPGVPGMEQPTEWTGNEYWEPICDGLWLKCMCEGSCDGQTYTGVWLAGYDPFAKQYTSIWVSSHDEPHSTMNGSFDAASKTFTFAGATPMGEMKSVLVCDGEDRLVETCFAKGEDGVEAQCAKIVRTRIAGAPAREAVAKRGEAAASEPLAVLAQDVGEWKATVTMSIPGMEPVVDQGTERIVPICDGKWFWSDYRGTMMGQPFEGHALSGYDATKKQYVGFWIDSMMPVAAPMTGTYDAANKQMTFAGTFVDPNGKPMKMREVFTRPDADTRIAQMTFTGADGSHEMKIVYERVKR